MERKDFFLKSVELENGQIKLVNHKNEIIKVPIEEITTFKKAVNDSEFVLKLQEVREVMKNTTTSNETKQQEKPIKYTLEDYFKSVEKLYENTDNENYKEIIKNTFSNVKELLISDEDNKDIDKINSILKQYDCPVEDNNIQEQISFLITQLNEYYVSKGYLKKWMCNEYSHSQNG